MTAKLHDHLSYPPRAMRAERAAAYLSISRSKPTNTTLRLYQLPRRHWRLCLLGQQWKSSEMPMTAPTQAQIEAAAKAMLVKAMECFPHGMPTGWDWSWSEIAKIALTAASEANPIDPPKPIPDPYPPIPLTAAEAGEKNPSLYHRSLANATIERCAQVAYEYGSSPVIDAIVAAIRAMKEKS